MTADWITTASVRERTGVEVSNHTLVVLHGDLVYWRVGADEWVERAWES